MAGGRGNTQDRAEGDPAKPGPARPRWSDSFANLPAVPSDTHSHLPTLGVSGCADLGRRCAVSLGACSRGVCACARSFTSQRLSNSPLTRLSWGRDMLTQSLSSALITRCAAASACVSGLSVYGSSYAGSQLDQKKKTGFTT